MAKQSLLAVLVAFVVSVLGCSSHEVLAPQGLRSPTTPENVKIHQKQPKKYEALGLVAIDITQEMKWDQKGDSPLAFEALKAKAAQLGANGVLLELPPADFEYKVTAGYQGQFYQVPARRSPKRALAQAIFVLEE